MFKKQKPVNLTFAQQTACDWIIQASSMGNIFHLWTPTGRGRTTVLQELHRKLGGKLLTLRDFVDECADRHPLALEDSLYKVVVDALAKNDTVIVDDWHVESE